MCAQSLSRDGFCDPLDCSPPGSFVHGILQARIPPPGDLSDPGIEPMSPVSPALAGGFFTTAPPRKNFYMYNLFKFVNEQNIFCLGKIKLCFLLSFSAVTPVHCFGTERINFGMKNN